MPGVAVSDLAPATAEDAEEFTQALELVLEGNAMALSGGWRLRADGVRRGVPKALGMTITEWCDRLGAKLHDWRIQGNRKDIVAELAAEEMSNREIAAVLGVSKDTVRNERAGEDSPPEPEEVALEAVLEDATGEDSPPEPEEPLTVPDLEDLAADDKESEPAKRKQRRQRDQKAEAKREDRQRRETAVDDVPPPDIREGTLSKALAGIADADLIFTDPPYPREFLPAWSELGEWAATALKQGALLVAYSGQYHLPEVMQRLSQHLDYQWLGWLATTGPQVAVHQRPIMSGGKPLLVFSNGALTEPYSSRRFFDAALDATFASRRTREKHTWEQAEGPAAYYIEALTERGELVVDPFLGSGTFAYVAQKLGRRFVGCDIDAKAVKMTRERLAA